MTQHHTEKTLVCTRPELIIQDAPQTHCAGCHYGSIYRILCEVVEEMGLEGQAVLVIGIGCSSRSARLFDFDVIVTPHGRPPCAATAVKRLVPDATVMTLQGDGGLLAIGAGHFINAMMRAEKITTLFLNNAGYGMTGGQMAPTTLTGMRTTTTGTGRDPRHFGFPLHAVELAAGLKGTAYAARCTVHTAANRMKAKKYLHKALTKQMDGIGYGIVEFLSACPTNWAMSPVECLQFMENHLIKEFPVGEFKDVDYIDYSFDDQMTTMGMTAR